MREKKKWSKIRIAIWVFFLTIAGVALVLVGITIYVMLSPQSLIVSAEAAEKAQCVIVPGSHVTGDVPSNTLKDRLIVAKQLYDMGKVEKILVSGDHSSDNYDEANTMRNYLLDLGVPPEDIFMDHAGFDTYQTMYRAKTIFQVESAIVATQDFHLPRALFIAQNLGIKVQGVCSSLRTYGGEVVWWLREIPGTWKAFWEVYITKPLPTYLGDAIPISGDGRMTVDEESE
ncbi:MAG: ElyC/SanA/YdcF family protein [Bacillota bacterium]|nr:ElyC/SanA/YdcF family protein [Bacillota bacterium]